MDNINLLLVAFMFITILTLGIAGILGELAEVVRNVKVKRDGLVVGWAVLLLFTYFVMFWHTADITLLEEWDFLLFLFAESGPVLLLFATQIMLGALTDEPDTASDQVVRQGRFFFIFALVQLWSIATGYVLGVGFTAASAVDLAVFVTCIVLAVSSSRQVHVVGLVIVWIAYIGGALMEWLS